MRNCEAGAEACCGTRGWRHGQIPRKAARNSIEYSFNIVRKRCNSNDLNSMYERVAGELRAKLGAVSAMRQVRSGRDTCAVATGPGRATSGRPTLQTSSNQRNSNRLTRTPVTNVVNPSQKTSIFSENALRLTTFVTTRTKPHASDTAPLVWRAPEGTSGPGRGAGGRRRGLAAVLVGGGGAWPGTPEPQAPPVWRAPEGPEGTGGLRGAAPNEVRAPSLAGGRALRRPEHPRRHKQQRNANARQPERAATRSHSQWNTQRSRAATTSATWTAFRAAPLRRLSPETTRTRPRLPSTA